MPTLKIKANRSVRPQKTLMVGQVRRFGAAGPVYVIREINRVTGICLVEVPATAEKLRFPLRRLLTDPLEN